MALQGSSCCSRHGCHCRVGGTGRPAAGAPRRRGSAAALCRPATWAHPANLIDCIAASACTRQRADRGEGECCRRRGWGDEDMQRSRAGLRLLQCAMLVQDGAVHVHRLLICSS